MGSEINLNIAIIWGIKIKYRGPDSNRHGTKFRGILSPLRLPIPPPRHLIKVYMEAAIGIEPMNNGFADHSLTTRVRRPQKRNC